MSATRPDAEDEYGLVVRIRAGDEVAFEALFRRYYPVLWEYLLSYVAVPDVAKDCAQDVLLWVWEHRDRWDVRQGGVRAYLYRAARNTALNHLRNHRVTTRWEDVARHDAALSVMGQPPAPADERLHAGELGEALRRAVDTLPARRREALLLRFQHHLTNAGIAHVMGVSVKMVEAHLAIALKSLRHQLEAHFQP